ncbi:replicative helicase loader/inhibitor [Paenibacillus sp.]|uniref:replicative helicase loader/inhibitor n=1 Tax=Paenibacillus sp. TaxID=58172 RepID=UPI002D2A7DC9|nr:replicative helicase loader/inhibitor [Paenibacillus sp.]HZG83862.1 replicative helicase loader/inhibitor [Paenibacillus sp.]
MQKAEVARLFEQVTMAYPNFTADKEKVLFWHQYLQDISFDQAAENLRRHIVSSTFPPTIADLRRPLVQKDPEQHVDYAKLGAETKERLHDMERWAAEATPPPWRRGGVIGD